MTVVDPIRDDRGWAFRDDPGYSHDPINGFSFLSEAYVATDPSFHGRVTVPVLWDKTRHRIVNNSEDDICRMFNDAFRPLARGAVDLFPADIADEQEKLSAFIYEKINNGVYESGFATSQKSYERACRALFAALDAIEARLGRPALPVRPPHRRDRLAPLLHPGALRRRLLRSFQVQPPAHSRLPESAGLPAGSLPAAGHRPRR